MIPELKAKLNILLIQLDDWDGKEDLVKLVYDLVQENEKLEKMNEISIRAIKATLDMRVGTLKSIEINMEALKKIEELRK